MYVKITDSPMTPIQSYVRNHWLKHFSRMYPIPPTACCLCWPGVVTRGVTCHVSEHHGRVTSATGAPLDTDQPRHRHPGPHRGPAWPPTLVTHSQPPELCKLSNYL